MTFTNIEFGAYMSENIDGSQKAKPFIFRPTKRMQKLSIPPEGQTHARPVVRLTGDGVEPLILTFEPGGIVGITKGKVRRVLSFETDVADLD